MPSATEEAETRKSARRRIKRIATASLVLALVALPTGFVCSFTLGPQAIKAVRGMITAAVIAGTALLVAIIGLIQIKVSRFRVWEQRLTLGAVVASFAALNVSFLAVAAGFRAQNDTRYEICRLHLRMLAGVLELYMADNDGVLPVDSNWCDSTFHYLRTARALVCPEAENLVRCGYAYNARLSGVDAHIIPDPRLTVVLFESDQGWNAAGGPELLSDEPRHFGGDNYGFADGHVQWLSRKRLGTDKHGNPIWAKKPDADWVIWEPVLRKPEAGPDD